MSSVNLVSITPNAEQTIMYCARVSNPKNQNSANTTLLQYCVANQHWSVFEMANMVIEIVTSRAIAQQILRHKSFSFQEFSQRYAKVIDFEVYEARRQDSKNRQNSIDDLSTEVKDWFFDAQNNIHDQSKSLYEQALKKGIAKECARFLLPSSARTVIYMNGTIRSWIHYLQLRTGNGTQKEHEEIAGKIKDIFIKELPILSNTLGFKHE